MDKNNLRKVCGESQGSEQIAVALRLFPACSATRLWECGIAFLSEDISTIKDIKTSDMLKGFWQISNTKLH